ncbi:hypothetical protein C2845_PM08G09700 [Panicum miliaceum]|uniref:Uncharacterized protein n=1 Tax=Panicum miliaceum TaxID=4540 RepID=A0A3L6R222_PANMI|nr:hypothetical protein C2845_PM08G09700 [Panicum miliaceum]
MHTAKKRARPWRRLRRIGAGDHRGRGAVGPRACRCASWTARTAWVGSLWRKRTYGRLALQLHKRASALRDAQHPAAAPDYLARDLEAHAARFDAGRAPAVGRRAC